jgi:two-component system, NarL family, response regulator NreC
VETPRRLRILLADDHATVREGLKLLIHSQPDLEVIAEASDGEGAIRHSKLDVADVVVMDLSMPGISGLVATRKLKELRPDLNVLVLTRHADEAYLHELLRAGVAGYVLKQSAPTELLDAIRIVASGGQYIDSALTRHLAAPFVARAMRKAKGGVQGATEREIEVLRLSAQGYSNKEIAAQLNVSVRTVEVHKANAMRKLSINGRIELLQFALVQGWLNR